MSMKLYVDLGGLIIIIVVVVGKGKKKKREG